MIEALTEKLSAGGALSRDDIESACRILLEEGGSLETRGAFLEALHAKGESPDEIAGFVEVLLQRALPLPFSGADCMDVCGTGGDRAGFFNVSTAVLFVAAACGVRVVKHGNRGITSKSGGADVLEALGVRIDLPPEGAARALDEAGCCFLFAPLYHPAFRAVAPVRSMLAAKGCTSIFNMLGPLLNPARPELQLSGVFNASLLSSYAEVFRLLGRRSAWAVHGTGPDGFRLDEVSPLGVTRVASLQAGEIRHFEIDPSIFPMAHFPVQEFQGGDAAHNAGIIMAILKGALHGAPRAIVQLNAAAALVVAGVQKSLPSAWDAAGAAIDSGAAADVLARLQSVR